MIWRILFTTVYIYIAPIATNAQETDLRHITSADLKNAEIIHQEYCTTCHQPDIYNNTDSTIKTIPQLRTRVLSCSVNSNAVWFDEEVDAVTTYLNIDYYLFGIK